MSGDLSRKSFIGIGAAALAGYAMTAATAVCAEPAACAPDCRSASKKLVATGWDVSTVTVDELLEASDRFAATPIDGVAFNLWAKDASGKAYRSGCPADSPFVWTKEMLAGDVPKLRAITAKQGLKDSLVAIFYHPSKRIGWDDDRRWAEVAATMRAVAWAAKQGGVRGFLVDPEDYRRQGQFTRLSCEPPFEELAKKARARGRQLFSGVFEEHPDAAVLGYWLLSYFQDGTKAYLPGASAKERNYLYPAFVEGMFEAAPPGVRLIDGCENGYLYEAACGHFNASAIQQRNLEHLLLPENRAKFRDLSRAGFGLWMGMYLPKGSRRAELEAKWFFKTPYATELARLADNLDQALYAAGEYVWLYNASERTSWIRWPAKRFANWKQWETSIPGITDVVNAVKDPDGWLEKKMREPDFAGRHENLVPEAKRKSGNLSNGRKFRMHIVKMSVKPGEFYGVRAKISGDDIQPIVRWRKDGEPSRPVAVPSIPVSFREPYSGKARTVHALARVPAGVDTLDFVVRAEPSKTPAVVESVEIWKMLAP